MDTHQKIEPKHSYVYFVIVGWNNIDLLDQCFESIEKQTYTHVKTIYVDNGSTDGSVAYVKKHYPTAVIIDAVSNQGFAIGNNMGIKHALEDEACDYVALLNTDAIVDTNWAETIIEFAISHKRAASFQTPTVDYYDHTILDSRGIKIDQAGRAIQLGYRENAKSYYEPKRIFGVNAAACIYTATFLKAQPFGDDYFDSDMWMYLEDVDLAARAIILGYDNWLIDGARAYHMGSASSGKNPGFSVYYIYRNNALMVLKNFSPLRFILMIPGIAYADARVLLSALRGRNFLAIRKIIRGRANSIPMLGLFAAKAKVLKKQHKVSPKALKKLMSAT